MCELYKYRAEYPIHHLTSPTTYHQYENRTILTVILRAYGNVTINLDDILTIFIKDRCQEPKTKPCVIVLFFEGGLKLGSATTTANTSTTTAATGFGAAAPLQLGVAKTTAPSGLTLGSTATTTASGGLKLGGRCWL